MILLDSGVRSNSGGKGGKRGQGLGSLTFPNSDTLYGFGTRQDPEECIPECPVGYVRASSPDLRVVTGGKMAGGKMGGSFVLPSVAVEGILPTSNTVTCVRSDCPEGFVRISTGGKMASGKRGSGRTDFTCVRATGGRIVVGGKMAGGKRGSNIRVYRSRSGGW